MANVDALLELLDRMIAVCRNQVARDPDTRPSVTLTWKQVKELRNGPGALESKKIAFRAFNPKVKIVGKPHGARLVDTV